MILINTHEIIFYVNSEKKGRYLSKNESASEPTKTNFHMKQISGWSVPSNELKIQ